MCYNSIIVIIFVIFSFFWFFLHIPFLVTVISCIYLSLVNAIRYSDFLSNLSVLHGIEVLEKNRVEDLEPLLHLGFCGGVGL